MCDTLCVVDGERLLFAKNSDRPAGEVQLVERWPARPASRATLHTQYLDLGADPGAHASIASRPAWLWGFEHGLNEYGVAVGNEKIWTTDDPRARPKALLGMDIVRLALERATTADEALDAITTLVEEYGQGGSGEKDADEPYDSAFLVADPARVWIVETSNTKWAARRVQHGGAAISNRVSLTTNWIRASRDVAAGTDIQTWRAPGVATARADGRLASTTACISGLAPSAVQAGAVVATLRDHGTGPWGDPRGGGAPAPVPPPSETRDDGYGVTVCMHTRDTAKVTTASMVCEVYADDRTPSRAWFALASPCISVYVPTFPPAVPAALADVATWRAFDRLRQRVEADGSELAKIRAVLDPVETGLWDDAERQWNAGVLDPSWPDTAWARVAAALDDVG
ncbi:MAG TPA: C69 family dipeptidase [Acidimicrobiia bacterium]